MVVCIPSQSKEIDDYVKYLGGGRPSGHPDHTQLTIRGSVDIYCVLDKFGYPHVGGFHNQELVAYLAIVPAGDGVPFPSSGLIVVRPEWRQLALSRTLLEWWVGSSGMPLMSDEGQTEEAQGVWRSLMQKSPTVHARLWRRDEGDYEDISVVEGEPDPYPWDGSPDRIVIYKGSWPAP